MSQKFLKVKCGYMDRAYQPREIARAAKLLLKHHPHRFQFDTLVGTGLSGALVIPNLARSLRKQFLLIRKDNDASHSSAKAEGVLGRKWLFVDDFISTGATFERVRDAVTQTAYHYEHQSPGFTTQLVGVFEYGDYQGARLSVWSPETHTRGDALWEHRLLEDLCTGCEYGCKGCSKQCHHCLMYQPACVCNMFHRNVSN